MDEVMVTQAIEYILRACTGWIAEVARKERRGFNPTYLIIAPVPFLERTCGNTREFRRVGWATTVAMIVFPRAVAIAVIRKISRIEVCYRFHSFCYFFLLLRIALVKFVQVQRFNEG
jgi:hypothetical protein